MTTFFSNLLVEKSFIKLLLRNNALENAINDQAEPKDTVRNLREKHCPSLTQTLK